MLQLNRKTFTLGAITLAALLYWKGRPISVPDGVLIPEAPEQTELSENERKPIKIDTGVVEPLARYKIRARVLSTNRYWLDPGAAVSPIDLALGWGPMSDSKVLNELSIGQSLRYYHVRWRNPPIPENEIMHHSANVHIIPANKVIKDVVLGLREGNLIELQGSLVMVSGKDGGEWKSSLSRDDTGAGACELMHVTAVRVLN
ncbi:hypothetical protein B9G69_009985 [Bdellovibrio sp. SKB1291214]|uniref:hypothetical protein n=1 Tax=Bdellovibrio sp. SKB1291214 TaxID=1732569 RepID=UPI000B515FAD|nr:hypothetical protein [Bdellovibrio sp. SKB1291214]UYL07374.1 hypothetical protein B9G69_009985 [Bdellovibrio sp. SKB1291214]